MINADKKKTQQNSSSKRRSGMSSLKSQV